MPTLPSGKEFGLSRQSLFDHGGNWFKCPDGHFWYWTPDLDINAPPFENGQEIIRDAAHAPVPRDHAEVGQFIQILYFLDDRHYYWRGEWLASFPAYEELDEADQEAWVAWLDLPQTKSFLDETISECERLAEVSRHASGQAVMQPPADAQPDERGWIKGEIRVPKEKG